MKFALVSLCFLGYGLAGGSINIYSTYPSSGSNQGGSSSWNGGLGSSFGSSGQTGGSSIFPLGNSGTLNVGVSFSSNGASQSFYPGQGQYSHNQWNSGGNYGHNQQQNQQNPQAIGTFQYIGTPKPIQTNQPFLMPIPPPPPAAPLTSSSSTSPIVAPIEVTQAPIPTQPVAPTYPTITFSQPLVTTITEGGQFVISSPTSSSFSTSSTSSNSAKKQPSNNKNLRGSSSSRRHHRHNKKSDQGQTEDCSSQSNKNKK